MEQTGRFGSFEDDASKDREAAERLLHTLVLASAIEPPRSLKENILGRLDFEGTQLDLAHLPPTDKYANHLSWLKVIRPLLPTTPVTTIFMQELPGNERIKQTLVVAQVDVPEEIHEEYQESFFILEGRCKCTIGHFEYQLGPGDHLDIPLHVPHTISLLTKEVTAILQYELQ